ncbi:unnamed protein product [Spirodela intermedia]|uniref:Uncharacterized protein n=2 Tax=Spirodela intermedia TaxID=51605 RepID=A0A7I8LMG1_SPIIN|nr:unnamed protein product [Spirodela intermedia]CAA6673225.1 unnamed protein product [Spirodela intermedia]CAA7410448.1 unnamed protein product [Spirodela intermedia]
MRDWRWAAVEATGEGSYILVFYAAVGTLCLVAAAIFSCAGGASEDKDSAEPQIYGSGCSAGCGAGCGGGCGA